MLILILFILISITSTIAIPSLRTQSSPTTSTTTPLYRATIVKAWPHSTALFTEGFGFVPRDLLHQNDHPVIYESTGLYLNQSASIRLNDYRTNSIILHRALPRGLFAEGCSLIGGVLFLATLSSNKLFLFEATTLKPLPIQEIRLPTQGPYHAWGMTTDPMTDLLYVSDGTSEIHVISIASTGITTHVLSINVHDGDTPIRELNELEWVNGLIYANVLGTSCICKILPQTGDVVGWINFEHAFQKWPDVGDNTFLLQQMNGIAYDKYAKVLLVTGKLWPYIFEITEGYPTTDELSENEISKCKPKRVMDYKHAHLGINNKLPLIPFPTANGVRSRYKGYYDEEEN